MELNEKQKEHVGAIIDKNVENLTEIQHLAISKIAKAFRFGCNWGYILRHEDLFAEKLEAIKENNTTKGLATTNGAIILADEAWLIESVNSVIPALDFNFVTQANERKAKERELFQRYLERATKGQGRSVERDSMGIHLRVGLYSTNDTNLINSNGKEYPAFKLNIEEAIYIALDTLSRSGNNLVCVIKPKGSEAKAVYANEYYMQSANPTAFYRDVVRASNIFDTLTGVHFEFWIV